MNILKMHVQYLLLTCSNSLVITTSWVAIAYKSSFSTVVFTLKLENTTTSTWEHDSYCKKQDYARYPYWHKSHLTHWYYLHRKGVLVVVCVVMDIMRNQLLCSFVSKTWFFICLPWPIYREFKNSIFTRWHSIMLYLILISCLQYDCSCKRVVQNINACISKQT